MQIPNHRVYKMIEILRGIENAEIHPSEAGKLALYLETNFKSKPNYKRDKSRI